MRRLLLLTFVSVLSGCTGGTQVFHATGVLHAGSSIAILADGGVINAYKPAVGQSSDSYTVSATARGAAPPAPVKLRSSAHRLAITSSGVELLVRVPDRIPLDAYSEKGDVNVTDISGAVNARADAGNVKVMVPGYAQASSGTGDVTVFMGATKWPGTLHFSADDGVVELWVNATAHFNLDLHVDDGTIFTDFPIRGTSRGTSETIVGRIGGTRVRQGIDVHVRKGVIRVLQLKPQV